MAKIVIDEEECIGCGFCEGICPEVFAVDESDGKFKAKVKPAGFSEETKKKVEEAAESCPVQAIKME